MVVDQYSSRMIMIEGHSYCDQINMHFVLIRIKILWEKDIHDTLKLMLWKTY